MGVKLVVEVLDRAPADLTPAERLLLFVIAENANDATREGWPGIDLLCRRTGLAPGSVQKTLRRLAEHGLDVRVARGKNRSGEPFYAARGQRTTYRIPMIQPRERADQETPILPDKPAGPDLEQPEKGRTRRRPLSGERADQEAGFEAERPDGSPAITGEGADHGPLMGGPRGAPSPQGTLKEPKAKSKSNSTEDHSIAGAEPPPPPRYGDDPATLPGPLKVVWESLQETHPGASLDEAREVTRLVATRHTPGNINYYSSIAASGGYGRYLAEVRRNHQPRSSDQTRHVDEAETRIHAARRTGPWCRHGEARVTLADGSPLCPLCRRRLPEPPPGDRQTDPEVVHVLNHVWAALDHQPTAQELVQVAAQATRLVKGATP